MQEAFAETDQELRRRRKNKVSTLEKNIIKHQFTKRNTENSFIFFYLQLGLVCTEIRNFVEYSQKNLSKALYSQQGAQIDKMTRILFQVSLQQQSS